MPSSPATTAAGTDSNETNEMDADMETFPVEPDMETLEGDVQATLKMVSWRVAVLGDPVSSTRKKGSTHKNMWAKNSNISMATWRVSWVVGGQTR